MSPTKEAQALAEKVVAGMMAKDAFSRWLGITAMDIAPDSAVEYSRASHGGDRQRHHVSGRRPCWR